MQNQSPWFWLKTSEPWTAPDNCPRQPASFSFITILTNPELGNPSPGIYPKAVFIWMQWKLLFCFHPHWHLSMIVLRGARWWIWAVGKNHVLYFLTQGNATIPPPPHPSPNPQPPHGLFGITCCLLNTNVPFCPKLKRCTHAARCRSLLASLFNPIHCKIQYGLHCAKHSLLHCQDSVRRQI